MGQCVQRVSLACLSYQPLHLCANSNKVDIGWLVSAGCPSLPYYMCVGLVCALLVVCSMRSEFLEQLEQWRLSSVEKAERTVAEKVW